MKKKSFVTKRSFKDESFYMFKRFVLKRIRILEKKKIDIAEKINV